MKTTAQPFCIKIVLLLLSLFSCNSNETINEDQMPPETYHPVIKAEQRSEEKAETAEIVPIKSEVIYTKQTRVFKENYYKDSLGSLLVKYSVKEHIIDSLNKIAPLYDTTKYNRLAVSYFTSLSQSLNGRSYFVNTSDSLINAIMEILTTRIDEGTDIMFLIDKTGSMADDINEVKKSMGMIMDYVSKFNNVKIGLAFYGDKNYHHQFWYNKTQLTSNIKEIRKLIDNFSIIGNPDTPESVNDAIVKTVEETNWTPGNRRLMLVIGDAVSQEPPLSSYTKKQVIQKCDSMNVKFNLYLIILGANQFHFSDPKSINKTFAKVFPNPANSYCEIDFNKEGFYYCELNDITGKKIISSTANKTNMNLNLSGIPSGTYLLQVYDNTLSSYYSTPLIIQH